MVNQVDARYRYGMNFHVFDCEEQLVKGALVTVIAGGEPVCQGKTTANVNRPLKSRFNTLETFIEVVVEFKGKSERKTVRSEERDVTFTLDWVRISKPILFISANPKNTARIRIDSEERVVKRQIDGAPEKAGFRLIPVPAARINDIMDALSKHRPMIVHFSGHAIRSGELLLEDDSSGSAVSVEPIHFFRRERMGLSCVFLNACFSRQKADEIAGKVPHVVVMKREIGDKAARYFSEGFYRGIVEGLEPPEAFQEGLASLGAHKINEQDVPMLLSCSKGAA